MVIRAFTNGAAFPAEILTFLLEQVSNHVKVLF
jgi:hypothetical protein